MSKSLKEKHLEMMSDPEYAREFALQEDEFQIARVLLRARLRAGMTQKEVAERMGTTQSVVARMESGKPLPSLSSINRYARAVGSDVKITLESRVQPCPF